jgi:hypothetical protein
LVLAGINQQVNSDSELYCQLSSSEWILILGGGCHPAKNRQLSVEGFNFIAPYFRRRLLVVEKNETPVPGALRACFKDSISQRKTRQTGDIWTALSNRSHFDTSV